MNIKHSMVSLYVICRLMLSQIIKYVPFMHSKENVRGYGVMLL